MNTDYKNKDKNADISQSAQSNNPRQSAIQTMRRYDKYKPSGVQWIGEIPEDWAIKRIKHLCYVKGRVGWKGLKASEFLISGYAYLVTGTDFKNGLVDWDNCYQIDEERYLEDPYIQLINDDLLVTKDGTIGKLAIVEDLDKPACLNSGIFVVRSLIDDFSTRYLYWILRSTVFSSYNNYTSYGSTIQHLYQNVFVEFNFCFPQHDEQTAIANYLDDKTAKIDTLIEKKKKLIELLKEERTAVINHYVLGQHLLIDNGELTMDNSQLSIMNCKLPKHWEVKKLKYEMASFDNLRVPISADLRNGEKVYDYYGASGVIDKVPDYLFDGEYILIGEDGANLLTRSTALAFKASGKFWVNNHAHVLKPKTGIIDYFVLLLETIDYTIWVTGSAQPKLTAENLMNIEIWFPSSEEQVQIVQHIETETKRIDSTISKIEKEIELLAEYRTALISEVVTGKIKVI